MDEEVDPSETLRALVSSLDAVEALLSPLLEKPWHETLEALDVLQRAKLQVLVSYAVNDLVWGM
jgi:exosome complex protein LRP1